MTSRWRPLRDLVVKLLGGIGAAVFVVVLAVFGQLETLEYWSLQQLFEFRGPRPAVAPIVIVAIDEASFQELAMPWPFPRAMHAQLIDKISAGKPLAIALDIVFDAPSSRGQKDDAALAKAIARAGNVVLGAAPADQGQAEPGSGLFLRREPSNYPIPEVRLGAAAVAPIVLDQGRDGHVRRAPQKVRVGNEWFDALDVALYRLVAKQGTAVAALPSALHVLINFRGGPQTFAWKSYYQVLNGEIPSEVFRDKVVYVGPTSPVLHDVFPTVFTPSGDMPGVEIHANVLETYVRGDAIREVPAWVSTVLAALAAILGAWLVVRLHALRALIVVVLAWITVTALAFSTFSVWDVWMRGMAGTVALALGYGSTVIANFIREQRERRQLSQFFSPDVLQAVVRRGSEISLRPSRRRLTVLFSDIRGFTSIAEKLEPEQLQEMLGEYLTEMTEIVFRHGGTVDKYIGDCVMALYNAPFEDANHAANAIRTGLELQERTLAVSARWEERLGVPIRNGVGINTGDAVVGTMGSRKRREYTAISDTVNVAARLESLTKDYGASIIISEFTYAEVKGQFLTRLLGDVTVKGKTHPVKIYAVLPSDLRKYPRAAIAAAAELVAVEGGRTCVVKVRDIGEGGLAVTGMPEAWRTGAAVQIRCEGGGLPKPLLVDGTIVWRHDDAAGIAFSALFPDAIATLGDYLAGATESRRGLSALREQRERR
jgi:adenylate cyclase